MHKNLFMQLSIGLSAGLLLVLGSWIFSKPYAYQGSLIDPPVPVMDFSLAASDGTTFQLKEQRGDVVLLFFGYTHCPDICPATLYDFNQVKARLEDRAENVHFVFVTVDPERDTLTHLKDYVTAFNEDFLALGGDFEALEPVWAAFGVYREEQYVGSAGGYFVDHTARVYVINPNGDLGLTFPFGMAPEAMTEDLLHLMKEAGL